MIRLLIACMVLCSIGCSRLETQEERKAIHAVKKETDAIADAFEESWYGTPEEHIAMLERTAAEFRETLEIVNKRGDQQEIAAAKKRIADTEQMIAEVKKRRKP